MSSVSVFIPCYNYAHYLRECVTSVLTQTGVDVRVLILDDASPDCTPEVATELMAHDSRVEYRRHATNIGHIANYNHGLAWADGDYTVLLSADDLLTPGALQRATQLMDFYPEVGFVYGNAIAFSDDQPPTARMPAIPEYQIWDGHDWLAEACRTAHIYIRSPEVVVRTSLQHRLGGYRSELRHTGDIEMWMRFAVHSAVGQVLNADQAFYRVHYNNMHLRQFSAHLIELQQRKAAYDTILRQYGSQIDGSARLQRLVYRRLAREALGMASAEIDSGQPHSVTVAELLAFALTTDPRGTYTPEHAGLLLRRALGPRLWSLLRPKVSAYHN